MEDPIVREIHAIRQRMFLECGEDLNRYLERLKAAELQDQERLVTAEQLQAIAEESKMSPHL